MKKKQGCFFLPSHPPAFFFFFYESVERIQGCSACLSGRGSHDKQVALASVIRNTKLVLGSFSARYILKKEDGHQQLPSKTSLCVCMCVYVAVLLSSVMTFFFLRWSKSFCGQVKQQTRGSSNPVKLQPH